MTENELKLVVAIAAAVATIVASVIAFVGARSNQRDLEKLKAELLEDKSESDAKRAYTYEALKRLYSQYEPIRFRLREACESAHELVKQIAEVASTQQPDLIGRIPRGNHLRIARIYHLLLPSVHFRIIQSCLTLIDLEASRSTFLQYLIAKQSCALFCRDRELADFFKLRYTPYVEGWRKLRIENPQQYRRQGFAVGRLENALSCFTKATDGATSRVLTFGEFELMLTPAVSEFDELARSMAVRDPFSYSSPLGAVIDLFDDFEPTTRPILWRMLLSQFVLYALFIGATRTNAESTDNLRSLLPQLLNDLSLVTGDSAIANEVICFVERDILHRIDMSFTRTKMSLKLGPSAVVTCP